MGAGWVRTSDLSRVRRGLRHRSMTGPVRTNALSAGPSRISACDVCRVFVELPYERFDTLDDVVPGRPNLFDGSALGVFEVPVEVRLPGDVRARVAAAHGHDDVGSSGEIEGERLRLAVREVHAELAH